MDRDHLVAGQVPSSGVTPLVGWSSRQAAGSAAITAQLGKKDRFDAVMAAFGDAYADQNEIDFAAMKKAAEDGRLEVADVF